MFMRRFDPGRLMGGVLLTFCVAGCGVTKNSTPATQTQSAPGDYFAPFVAGAFTGTISSPSLFSIDDTTGIFSQTTYQLEPPEQQGPQVLNAGVLTTSQRGLRSLGITAQYMANSGTGGMLPGYYPVTYNPPQAGSFAVELAGQAGGLVQLVNQPAQPLVAATQCPSLAKPQTYLFITIPAALGPAGVTPHQVNSWDPTTETAYGTVDISSSGDTVAFQNIQQFTLPSEGGSGAPAIPAAASMNGACGPTFFGDVVNAPGQLVITDPGNGQTTTGQASLGIGASGGLLVEDNGAGSIESSTAMPPALPYVNLLGAGTGAVGLPQPASALTTSSIAGAQYLGFIYAAGVYSTSGSGWSSHLASFGFTTVPSACASVAASTTTLIYGGDFANDNPSASSGGFGNCDFAIDLGTQSASTSGLYPQAKVWVGASYAANPAGATYSFPAVAIAGQISGKFAIFVIGVDSKQPWAIYLLQSN